MKGKNGPVLRLNTSLDEITATSTGASEEDQSRPAKDLLERILSSPLVSYLRCGGRWQTFDGTKPYKASLRESFAPKAIIQSMKQFPLSARVQRIGCGSLQDIATDSLSSKEKIMEEGGDKVIFAAIRNHENDKAVQVAACNCLYNLFGGDITHLLVERGIICVLLSIMECHSHDEDVIPAASDCLLVLTNIDADARCMLRQKRGGLLLAKIENHFNDRNVEIRKKASELLRRLYTI